MTDKSRESGGDPAVDEPRHQAFKAQRHRIKELEREVRRKDKALAEVTALLVLKKKLEAIWGDGDDDTPTTSGS